MKSFPIICDCICVDLPLQWQWSSCSCAIYEVALGPLHRNVWSLYCLNSVYVLYNIPGQVAAGAARSLPHTYPAAHVMSRVMASISACRYCISLLAITVYPILDLFYYGIKKWGTWSKDDARQTLRHNSTPIEFFHGTGGHYWHSESNRLEGTSKTRWYLQKPAIYCPNCCSGKPELWKQHRSVPLHLAPLTMQTGSRTEVPPQSLPLWGQSAPSASESSHASISHLGRWQWAKRHRANSPILHGHLGQNGWRVAAQGNIHSKKAWKPGFQLLNSLRKWWVPIWMF